jgi:hypothetical protein
MTVTRWPDAAMIDPVTLSRLGLWVIATVMGGCGVFCLIASFVKPPFAAYAIVYLGTATGITLAVDEKR